MKKTTLYRLFGVGSVPKKLLPVLETEGVVVLDEGIGGWFITKHVLITYVSQLLRRAPSSLVTI
jgi:hypothetical protein